MSEMNRREFVKLAGTLAVGAALSNLEGLNIVEAKSKQQ